MCSKWQASLDIIMKWDVERFRSVMILGLQEKHEGIDLRGGKENHGCTGDCEYEYV